MTNSDDNKPPAQDFIDEPQAPREPPSPKAVRNRLILVALIVIGMCILAAMGVDLLAMVGL